MGETDWQGNWVLFWWTWTMFSKSLIQFSVDEWGCVPSLLFTLGQTVVKIIKIMVTSFERSHAFTDTFSAPSPAAGHHQPTPLLETPGDSQASLGQSLVWSLLFSLGFWCTQFCLCPPRIYFPVLCKFWQLYSGVNGELLQEGFCHTQVCYTQRPCPCRSPLPTCTSTGNYLGEFWACWSLAWRILSMTLLACEMSTIMW